MDDLTVPAASSELTFGQEPAMAPQAVAAPAPVVLRGKMDRFGVAMATGRRKTAIARVRMKPGTGVISINGRNLDEFFTNERDRLMVLAPLKATEQFGSVDVWARVNGGGTTGQTGAMVMGIARALETLNVNHHSLLSENGFLTRDSRMVERKHYGRKKARRAFQFSKR